MRKVIVTLLLLSILAASGHAQLTTNQVGALKSLEQQFKQLDHAVRWANDAARSGTVTNTIISTNVVTRDVLEVRLEQIAKNHGQTYHLSVDDTYGEMMLKFRNAYLALTNYPNTVLGASNQGRARDSVVSDQAEFRVAYGLLKTLDVTADATVTNITTNIVLSVPWAVANGFPQGITEEMIREALTR